jgi:hypothetical protein
MSVVRSFVVAVFFAASSFAQTNPAADLAGVWQAKLRFGPDVRGPLTIARDADAWRGEIAGRTAVATVTGDHVRFTLAQDLGSFDGRFTDTKRTKIEGHWIQPVTLTTGNRFASPVTLTRSREPLARRGRTARRRIPLLPAHHRASRRHGGRVSSQSRAQSAAVATDRQRRP